MGGLVGIVRLDGGPVDRAIVERWKTGSRGSRFSRVRTEGAWAYAWFPPPYLASETLDPQPFRLRSGQLVFVEGRLDERDELVRALGPDAARASDPALIAGAYDLWGPTAHERLYGDFAVALWDEGTRRLILARDALGTRSLYYHFDGASVRYATSLHLLLAIPGMPRDIDELALANFMVRATETPERTLYRDIFRVPSGGTVTFSEGTSRKRVYWTLDGIASLRLPRDEDYVEMGRTLLDNAVASRLPATGQVTTTLSGGFDSAAITATAARLLGDRRLTAITRAASAHDPYQQHWFDEKALAGLVAGQYSNIDWIVADELHQHERDFHPEMESAAMGVPVLAPVATWFEPVDLHAAAIGTRSLLSGGWGNATLSWTGNGLCFEQVRGGRLIAAARDVTLRARRQGKPAWPALRRELVASLEPRGLRRWRRERNAGPQGPWQRMAMFAPDFLHSVDYSAHTDSIAHDILRKVPRTGRELRWSMMHRPHPADRHAYLQSRAPHEMLDPFRDRRMAEFTLGTPERQFQRDGIDRWLARRVLADRLPPEVLTQTRRGIQNGEWYHLASLRREATAEAVERMARSPLANRVLDVPFLKSLVDSWPEDAESAMHSEVEHRHMLEYGVAVGSFLRWHEGSNG